MDYSYFSAPQHQPFQFFGLATPHQTHTPQPDEFSHRPQQVGSYDPSYDSFDPTFRFDPATLIAPPHSPPESFTKHSVGSNEFKSDGPPQTATDTGDDQSADRKSGRSSSEEKDTLTPAQSRRKAQNRAAQRAFRERKERHVRELEQKLSDLEQASNTLHADNERLKRELAKYATENEILRATSNAGIGSGVNGRGADPETTTTGPMKYSPTDFYSSVLAEGERMPTHRITVSEETGERLLDAGATWDMIQGHELFKRGLVDIGDVCERLKGVARCDGQGPVFEESVVRRAIEESVAGGSDELI
ncbi:hypothetical protein VTN00DRAFT_1706 [Thermoascus crustaceus]|uniref:uncharacterized protein n=1 Tax=Thermoascus crustaceus TaxID=5088 RepID=UPI00374268B5